MSDLTTSSEAPAASSGSGGSVATGERTAGAGAGFGSPETVGGPANPVTVTPVYVDPGLLPETVRSAPTLTKFMEDGRLNVGKVVDSYRNLEALHGVPPDQIVRMPQNEGDWEKVYNKLGRPEKADGYSIEQAPKEFKEFAHKLGLNQLQAKQMWDEASAEREKAATTRSANHAKVVEQQQTQLRNEWGSNFDRNADLAQKAAMRFGGEALMELFEKSPALGNNPALVRAFYEIGKLAGESNMLTMGSPGGTGGMQPQAAQAEIKRLGNDKAFTEQLMNAKHEKHAEAKERWQRLHDQAYPELG